MNEFNTHATRILFPLITTSIYFLIILKKESIKKTIKKTKNKASQEIISKTLKTLEPNTSNPIKTILIPATSAITLAIALSLLFNQPLQGYKEPLWFALITSGFLNPIAEELLFRGILLGTTTSIIEAKTKERKKQLLATTLTITITSIIFAISHENTTAYQTTSRILNSILFSILYLINKNLLAPITAHSTQNILLAINDATTI